MMTKHLLREVLNNCMGHLDQWRMSGRAKSQLEIEGKRKGDGEKSGGREKRRGGEKRKEMQRTG